MQPNGAGTNGPTGLPPVQLPTTRHMVQMFVVPLLIVVIALGIFAGVVWLVGGSRTPDEFLRHLESDNPDVRWRAANDLAQVLKRDDTLASDARFVLRLTELLRRTVRDCERLEHAPAGEGFGPGDSPPARAKALENSRKLVIFLSACLGNSAVPVGAPLLCEVARESTAADPAIAARERARAIWALANLADSLRRFDNLRPERQQVVLAELEGQAGQAGESGAWARQALDALRERVRGQPRTLGVEETLRQCASDPNPFLRLLAGQALTLWQGTADENQRIDQALFALTRDAGQGDQLMAPLAAMDEDRDERRAEGISRRPGAGIRYQAAAGLALRGSPLVDDTVLTLLDEMLDEEELRRTFFIKSANGSETPDEATIYLTMDYALRAIAELHRRRPTLDLARLKPAVESLTSHANPALRAAAQRTQLTLGGQP
ncbi:MAG: hypothetical protein NZ700_03750 [Gemmataceae bacterium]|nr:hypothetical protein [Gemmataceae bacterium]MDW8266263.1 hypothetical protein [Gemmataceae bacterium]